MSDLQIKKFVVTRFDPDSDDAPRTDTYEVPCHPDWKVLDAISKKISGFGPPSEVSYDFVRDGMRTARRFEKSSETASIERSDRDAATSSLR